MTCNERLGNQEFQIKNTWRKIRLSIGYTVISIGLRALFPIYAYTSKDSVLLSGAERRTISQCGARVLLKTKMTPEGETAQISADIASRRKPACAADCTIQTTGLAAEAL